MLIFPDPNVETEYTDPNGSVWEFNGTGWVRQCAGSGGDQIVDLNKLACFEITYSKAGYTLGGDANNHPMLLRGGDFTLQWWVKTSQNSFSLLNPQAKDQNKGCLGVWADGGTLFFVINTLAVNQWTWNCAPIIDRQWHHIRICRKDGVHSLYIDAVDKSAELSGSRNDTKDYNVIPPNGTFWGSSSPNSPSRGVRYAGIQIVRGFAMGQPEARELRLPFSPCTEAGAENLICVNVYEGETDLVDIGEFGNPVAIYDNPSYTLNTLDSPYTWNPPMRIYTEEELALFEEEDARRELEESMNNVTTEE